MFSLFHKKPYLKKVARIGDFTVYEVDGTWIRGHLDDNFTNFGQHYRFPFVPMYELWLDRERTRGERHFFIDHLLLEWRLMHHGVSYGDALRAGDRKELAERRRSRYREQLLHTSRPELLKSIHKEKLHDLGTVQVWVVRGELVRGHYFIDYTEGGHDLVYKFIPKGEIWLDDDLIAFERNMVLLHELWERAHMQRGYTYAKAHLLANRYEIEARHDPQTYAEKLQRALAKQK